MSRLDLGAEIGRFATINDLHVGEPWFGILPKIVEKRGRYPDGYALRAARAAIDEALAWGAESIVVKGDITWSGRPLQWQQAAELFAACPVPVAAVVGNHDVSAKSQDGRPWLAGAGLEVIVDDEVPAAAFDTAGVRVALVHTTVPQRGVGRIQAGTAHVTVRLLDERPSEAVGSLVMMHHYVNRFPVSTRYPRGVRHDEGDELLRTIAAAELPPTLLTVGHSHRNRRYQRHGIDVTEVGSTKDYPGVWAAYTVHERGLRQRVVRIQEPSVVEWTDRTARSALGLWGRWTPGLESWRDVDLRWR